MDEKSTNIPQKWYITSWATLSSPSHLRNYVQKLMVSLGFLAVGMSLSAFTEIRTDCSTSVSCDPGRCPTRLKPPPPNLPTITAAAFPFLCTTDTQQPVIACYSCIETNAPNELTGADLAPGGFNVLQTAYGNLGVRCVCSPCYFPFGNITLEFTRQ
jgi:hypothetical protein